MEEAERLCDRSSSSITTAPSPATRNGIYRLPAPNVPISVDAEPEPANWLTDVRSLDGIRAVDLDRSLLRIGVVSITQAAPRILDWLNARGVAYDHVSSERANLETVFLTLTGRSLRDS
jgi:ABC-2 type transport system ATP-binding protein